MNVLIACEESQRVTSEFLKLGHNVYSCDVVPTSGEYRDRHIMQDVLPLLNGNCYFKTMDGVDHYISGHWDLIIAFPPCTYLTITGNRWFNIERYGQSAITRMEKRNDAVEFFMKFVMADCEKIGIENPVGVMSTIYRKPTQIIQPYYFGDPYEKRTCLWLKGLPKLEPTNIVEPPTRFVFKSEKTMATWYAFAHGDRATIRSKTFPGLAKAMAQQWGREK